MGKAKVVWGKILKAGDMSEREAARLMSRARQYKTAEERLADDGISREDAVRHWKFWAPVLSELFGLTLVLDPDKEVGVYLNAPVKKRDADI